MVRMNLNFLTTFLSVAEHGSFRRAANEVCRSQSAVSMQIRQLEEEIGVFLFRRTTRKVELTSEGEHLMRCARKALAELYAGVNELQNAAAARKGLVRIGCVPTFAPYVAGVIARLEKMHPGVGMGIEEASTIDVLDAVRTESVLLGIAPRVAGMPDLDFDFVMHDELCALLPDRYALPGRKEINVQELARIPLLMQRGPAGIRTIEEAAFERRGVDLQPSHVVQQSQTLVSMAEKGIGAAIITRLSLPTTLPDNLQLLRIPELATVVEVCVVTLRSLPPSGLTADLKTIIHQVAGHPASLANSTTH